MQIQGMDYNEPFASTAKVVTVRLLLVLVAHKNWFVHQMNINNPFLHGTLKEELFIVPP